MQYRLWPNRLARLLADALNNEVYVSWPDWLRREIAAATVARAVPLPLSAAQIDAVITRCKELESDEAMLGILDAIEGAAGRRTYTERDLLDWDEVRQMAASGLIRFGSHTRRHIRLDAHTKSEVLRQEICESRTTIERQLGTPVRSFCYPNGDHCPAAVELVRRCYSAAVTTQRAWNTRTSNRHPLLQESECTLKMYLARAAGIPDGGWRSPDMGVVRAAYFLFGSSFSYIEHHIAAARIPDRRTRRRALGRLHPVWRAAGESSSVRCNPFPRRAAGSSTGTRTPETSGLDDLHGDRAAARSRPPPAVRSPSPPGMPTTDPRWRELETNTSEIAIQRGRTLCESQRK